MIESVDKYLSRQYDIKRYNCLHFARDVWLDHTGVDITEHLQNVFHPDQRTDLRKSLRAFERITEPVDPCLVMMHRPRLAPHVGVYLRGKVLHIWERGVEFLPVALASRGFESVRFYLCR